jgi:quinoprotein glucose dehydrogenase
MTGARSRRRVHTMSWRNPVSYFVLLVLSACVLAAENRTASEWPTYGHDSGGQRFSPLTQVTPDNVTSLKAAWVYHMRPEGALVEQGFPRGGRSSAAPRFAVSEATPLIIRGILYTTTPYHRVVALDAISGREMWTYHLPANDQAELRGVEYWPGNRKEAPRILFGTRNGKLIELDAATGEPVIGFGDHGMLNTNTSEILNGFPNANDGYSSTPIVYKDLVITGGMTQEWPTLGAAGDVRAWDVHTGSLKWTFHSVPRPGERFHDTWEGDSWKGRSGTNVWGFMTVDQKRGIVYLPFGAPAYDRYGGDRLGDNLFDTSLVAVDARTGKYLWHFQVVHHDIWDYDLEAPPVLIDIKHDGKTVPAVAVINKTSLLFLLDRVTGKPIFGVEERPVPASDLPKERASPTQPFPLKPAPLARMSMAETDVATVTPELEAYCRKLIADNNLLLGGPYQPVTYQRLRVQFPGTLGGANWGGMSFDPNLGYLFVNTSDLGQVQGFTDRAEESSETSSTAASPFRRADPNVPYTDMPRGGRFKEPISNMMCNQPPWGSLTAVNVNTAEVVWRSTLGVTDSLPNDKKNTGRPNLGGSIATASGLVFIGGTDDDRFRAFDAKTGKELWTYRLGAAAVAVPSTYLGRDGKQYIVVVSTGGSFIEAPLTDDSITAFTLAPSTTLTNSASPEAASGNLAPQVQPLRTPQGPVPSGGLPPGTGHDITVTRCGQCHDISVVSSVRHTREQWGSIIDAMVARGMNASDVELTQMQDYLADVRGPVN